MKIASYFSVCLLCILHFDCRKLVQIPPPTTSLTSVNVYTDDATAIAVLIGIYSELSGANPLPANTINSISLTAGLSSDELTLYGGVANANTTLAQFYLNSLTSSATSGGYTTWNDFYSKIYTSNIALEGLSASNSLTPSVKKELIGEAKFLRAFFFFYLTNLYGDVPLTTSSDYSTNSILFRSLLSKVYEQLIADLKDAQYLLTDGYVGADAKSNTTERVLPNKWAATAMLARAYLYRQQWDSAEAQATALINHTELYNLLSLNNVFKKNSLEAIWQLQPVNTGWNTEDARFFILPGTGPTDNSSFSGYPVYLSPQLMNSFEPGDQRRMNWVDSVISTGIIYYYPNKYKSATLNAPVTEYTMVLRLAEQYLIRAEARAQQNNIGGAQSDLNVIRARAGLGNTAAADQTSLLTAILHERQTELFTEWGHRWLDLKRTGKVDAVMSVVAPEKGGAWNTNWQLYPIPIYDIIQDPNLVQNLGY